MTNVLVVNEVFKSYPAPLKGHPPVEVLGGLGLSARDGEVVALFAPNGAGKTTFLHVIAGVLSPDSGQIEVKGARPEQARVSYVFQDFSGSLLPWKTVKDNIGLPLEIQGVNRPEKNERVHELVERLRMEDIPLAAFPYQLSGGQKQWVAIARGLIAAPDLLLLDEPFSALDYRARLDAQEHLLRVLYMNRVTTVVVSHEIDEAVLLSDRVVVLTGRPARVVGEVTGNFLWPRDARIMRTKVFVEARQQVHNLFLAGIGRAA